MASSINIERNFFSNEKDKEAKINMLAAHLHSYIHSDYQRTLESLFEIRNYDY